MIDTFQKEFFMLMSACEKLERDNIHCYALKTLHNLSKNLTQNKYEIILEAYTKFLENLEHIKNNYKQEKSNFKTYIYFYLRKYLLETIRNYIEKYEKYVDVFLFDDEEYDNLLNFYCDECEKSYNIDI